MERGDIYLVFCDPNSGHEQRGRRPVIVATAGVFNRLTKAPVVLPITSGGRFARTIGFAVTLLGTRTTGLIRCDQPRTIDLVARKAKRLERAPEEVVEEMLAKVAVLFE